MNADTITAEQLGELLTSIRLELSITWADTELDTRLKGLIKRGISYINDCAGAESDYIVEGQAKSLLFDYVRYARSGHLNDFWEDYKRELSALRSAMEVAAYVASLTVV